MARSLTPDEVHTARLMRREGKTIQQIALQMNRSRALVGDACRGYARLVQQAPVVNVPESVLAERAARLALSPRDLTAAIAGDPLPGMSALECGQEKWEPVFRPAVRPTEERSQPARLVSAVRSSRKD
ncbi:MAG TPA: hypothetical protein VJL90_00340 [Pseudorhodoplanes sp.]|nr:hypothetical protein [Pseudorhodoplanes sp.]